MDVSVIISVQVPRSGQYRQKSSSKDGDPFCVSGRLPLKARAEGPYLGDNFANVATRDR